MLTPVDVVGIGVGTPDHAPVLLLRERDDDHRVLPIVVGGREAMAVLVAQGELRERRPGTITLINDVVQALGHRVVRVEITELRDGTFFAELVFTGEVRVSARPSDAVALALRAGALVAVDTDVLDDAAVDSSLFTETDVDAQVDEFCDFLDQIDPEDFTG